MEEKQGEAGKRRAAETNWLALGMKVFAAIVVFNIIATLVFYFFIAPRMH